MPRKPDLTIIGKTYNNLTVDKLTDFHNSYGRRLYECTCLLCGKKRLATKANLQRNEIKDCGNHHQYKDLTGQKFGRLEALYITDIKSQAKNRCKIWHCRCDCGNECNIPADRLIGGKTLSCGCLQSEKHKKLFVDGTSPCKLNGNKLRATNTSGVTGVWYDKSRHKWCAEIMFKKKKYYLGRYEKKEDAIAVRKDAEHNLFESFLEWYERIKEDLK